VSAAWPTTSLQSGQTITFQYAEKAAHPGSWTQYITKDGWDPNKPLAWGDLVQFDRVVNPPAEPGGRRGSPVHLDRDAAGQERPPHHLLDLGAFGQPRGVLQLRGRGVPRWRHADPDAHAYSDGDADSYSDAHGDSYSDAHGDADPDAHGDADPDCRSSCKVTFTTTNSWSNGFQGGVTIANNSSAAVSPWELKWTFTKGETLTQAWNATATQSGTTVTAKNPAWSSTIPANGSVSFGYPASSTGSTATPTGVTLNGKS